MMQAVLQLQRAERAEAALVVVKREWRQSKENLSRVQEASCKSPMWFHRIGVFKDYVCR